MSRPEFISIVIPALNEEAYIKAVVESLLPEAGDDSYEILVMDGGSVDRTREIVQGIAARNPRVRLVDNPGRIQSAAVNLAAREADSASRTIIRADAHCTYPRGFARYVANALQLRRPQGAVSVVVPMHTKGNETCFQKAVAVAQNSRFGNGGSAHRRRSGDAGWIDHGHHAAFDREFFLSIGGYDEGFAVNEDAEYDIRVAKAGGRVWLETAAMIAYHPRKDPWSLWKQYHGYGRGRAMTTLKHRVKPKLRQMIPLVALAGCVAGVAAAPFHAAGLALPAGYAAACALLGLQEARKARGGKCGAAAGAAFFVMHMAWAIGFVRAVAERLTKGAK